MAYNRRDDDNMAYGDYHGQQQQQQEGEEGERGFIGDMGRRVFGGNKEVCMRFCISIKAWVADH